MAEKRSEVVHAEDDRAVAARREPDEGAALTRGDRPEVRVDVVDEVVRDVGLPVPAGAPVQVLGVRVSAAGTLRLDEDRGLPAASRSPASHLFPAYVVETGGQAVQEVDDRIARRSALVARRQEDERVHPAVESRRMEAHGERKRVAPSRGGRRARRRQRAQAATAMTSASVFERTPRGVEGNPPG